MPRGRFRDHVSFNEAEMEGRGEGEKGRGEAEGRGGGRQRDICTKLLVLGLQYGKALQELFCIPNSCSEKCSLRPITHNYACGLTPF